MNWIKSLSALLFLGWVFNGTALEADVKMPAIFGDHMVLQGDGTIPVWGWAAAGEKVTVSLGAQKMDATAAQDGTWRVNLTAVPATTEPQTLTVAGTNTITFQDVLIGDVWLAGGQSNMEFSVAHSAGGAAVMKAADEPLIRLFFVPKQGSTEIETMTGPAPEKAPLEGKWVLCTPESLAADGDWAGFSAVAYFFGREIQQETKQPLGLIADYWGGTSAQAWCSVATLQKEPMLAHILENRSRFAGNFANAKADHARKMADYRAAIQQWTAASGTPEPKPPAPMDQGPWIACNLYNGMLAPIIPYAIKGVIWYQGESNSDSKAMGQEYKTLFPLMITSWREQWGQGNFPFLFVQLAKFADKQSPDGWAWTRESQGKTLSLPNTGMASAVDLGEPGNIHPGDKMDVGHRLALAAEHLVYGKDIVFSGPLYDAMKVEGNQIRLNFTDTGSGLMTGKPPGVASMTPLEPADFMIAGEDQKWMPAKATLDGNSIVVRSDQVPLPVAVRYGWSNSPVGNVYNKEGLPLSPFRTDSWD